MNEFTAPELPIFGNFDDRTKIANFYQLAPCQIFTGANFTNFWQLQELQKLQLQRVKF